MSCEPAAFGHRILRVHHLRLGLQALGDDLLWRRRRWDGWQRHERPSIPQREAGGRYPARRSLDHEPVHRRLGIAIGQDHEAEGVRAPVSDHGQVVRGAGRALGLDEEVSTTRLGSNAPGRFGLRAIAAQSGSHLGDRLIGVEHHQRHHTAFDGYGDHGARVVNHFAQAWIGGLGRHRRARNDEAQGGREAGQALHGLAPGAAVLISGSDLYAVTTKPNGFSSRSRSFASTLGWYWKTTLATCRVVTSGRLRSVRRTTLS